MAENGSSTFGHINDFLNTEEKVILTLILSCLTVLGIFANALVVYVLLSLGMYVDVPANLFIMSQAVAHLGNAIAVICYISHIYRWNWVVLLRRPYIHRVYLSG